MQMRYRRLGTVIQTSMPTISQFEIVINVARGVLTILCKLFAIGLKLDAGRVYRSAPLLAAA